MRRSILLVLVILSVIFVAGCTAQSPIKIQEIYTHSSNYTGENVTIEGTLHGSNGSYYVKDSTGMLEAVMNTNQSPDQYLNTNKKYQFDGTIKSSLVIASNSIAIFVKRIRNADITYRSVSVSDLALTPEKYQKDVVTDGFVNKDQLFVSPFGPEPTYSLYDKEIKYKIKIIGSIPSPTSDSCGVATFPYYRIKGEFSSSFGLNIESSSLIECVKIENIRPQ